MNESEQIKWNQQLDELYKLSVIDIDERTPEQDERLRELCELWDDDVWEDQRAAADEAAMIEEMAIGLPQDYVTYVPLPPKHKGNVEKKVEELLPGVLLCIVGGIVLFFMIVAATLGT